jgi:hypothetical protein
VSRLAFVASAALAAVGVSVLAAGSAYAQRPSEQDMFGGPAPSASPDAGAPGGDAGPPLPLPSAETAPITDAPPAAAAATAATPPATQRDQELLGSLEGGPSHLSDYQAPENPLAIGGQLYLRTQVNGLQAASLWETMDARNWSLSTPNLLDVYFDVRPNPRVRAFILARTSFNPAAPPGDVAAPASEDSGGAFSGGSATGFTTFNAGRGPASVLDQMWMRFDIKQRVFVTAGKQHVRWGTGRFWQPTDYLHAVKRNPLDVFDARPGASMLKLHIPWEDKGWNFYAYGVTEDPNQATNFVRQVAGGARAEIVIADAEIGLDVLAKAGQKPRVGVDVSTGIWEFDVYADVGIRAGEDFNVVHRVTDPNEGVVCAPIPGRPASEPPPTVNNISAEYAVAPLSGVKTQAVGGINWVHKYNDNDIFTIGAEYFYNQPGYSDPSLYPGLLFNQSGQQMLNFFYTGRHYGSLFASFPMPYSWNLSTFTLSTLGNLSDMSFISRLDFSYVLLTHLSLETFIGVHYGSSGGEFRLGFDVPAQYRIRQPAPTDGSAPICDVIPPIRRDPALIDVGIALRMKL